MRFLMLSGLLLASCGYEPSSPLARAAFEKDSASFDRLLPGSAHAQIDEALVAAARAGNAEAIPKLAAADANLDRPSGVNEWTPLQHAVHKNQLSAVKALLASGASPQSGLIMAAGYGQADIVKALLEAGANPALAGPKGNALDAALSGTGDIDRWTLGDCQTATVAALRERNPTLEPTKGTKAPCAEVERLLAAHPR